MNNKPYFENVYIYGDLYLDKVLLEYEFFSYSILKDNKGNFFVCYCYEVEKRQSWLINEIKKSIAGLSDSCICHQRMWENNER